MRQFNHHTNSPFHGRQLHAAPQFDRLITIAPLQKQNLDEAHSKRDIPRYFIENRRDFLSSIRRKTVAYEEKSKTVLLSLTSVGMEENIKSV